MALFESYERREKQILAVLKEYGISSIEECADVCKAKGQYGTFFDRIDSVFFNNSENLFFSSFI